MLSAKIKVPKTFHDITINAYQQAYLVFHDAEYEDELMREVDWLAALCECSPYDIMALPRSDFFALVRKLMWVKTTLPSPKFPKIILSGGRILRPKRNVAKWETSRAVDFSHFAKKKDDAYIIANIHKIVTCAMRWNFERTWKGDKLNQRSEWVQRNISIAAAYPMALFFSQLMVHSSDAILDSLTQQMREMMTEAGIAIPSLSSTHGYSGLINSQERTA